MNFPKLDTRGLLKSFGISAKKSLGQNFLVNETILEKIIRNADIQPSDHILEIGAGLGNLTRYLASSAEHVVAIELDSRLIPILSQVTSPFLNIAIVKGDILKLDHVSLFCGYQEQDFKYRVVANIPYNITSAVIRHLLDSQIRPSSLVLTVQLEVARRICAEPGDLSLLALSVQVYGQPKIIMRVPSSAFYPVPRVDSAVVKVDILPQPQIPTENLAVFFRLAKAGFGQKRKTLRNALSMGMQWSKEETIKILDSSRIDDSRRAETLSIYEWSKLTKFVIENENFTRS